MIATRFIRLAGLIVPIAVLAGSVQGDCPKKRCKDPCEVKVKVSRCADPCPRVERCADPCPRVKQECAKGDIEDLNACLPCGSNELTLRYDVEIDHAGAGQFDLLVDVINNGERIHQITIPLDNPNEVDDDEMEFEATITENLPMTLAERCDLRVEGNIIPRAGASVDPDETLSSAHGESLDKKVARVDMEDDDHGIVYGTFTESVRFVSYPVRAVGGEDY